MTREGSKAFSHADLFKAAGFFGIKGVLSEAEASTEEDHAHRGSGCDGLGSFGGGERFQEGKSQNGTADAEEGASGSRIGVEGHERGAGIYWFWAGLLSRKRGIIELSDRILGGAATSLAMAQDSVS